jgi:hypothetical protein
LSDATSLPPADLVGVVLPVKLPNKSAKPNENRIHHTFMYCPNFDTEKPNADATRYST